MYRWYILDTKEHKEGSRNGTSEKEIESKLSKNLTDYINIWIIMYNIYKSSSLFHSLPMFYYSKITIGLFGK